MGGGVDVGVACSDTRSGLGVASGTGVTVGDVVMAGVGVGPVVGVASDGSSRDTLMMLAGAGWTSPSSTTETPVHATATAAALPPSQRTTKPIVLITGPV